MARERWRQQGDNRPQVERDRAAIAWNGQIAQAQANEQAANAQAIANQQPPARRPEGDVHINLPHPPQEDARHPLQRMGDELEDAFRDENKSRVAQMREGRQMQHAKDIESMRQEGLLQRLQAMNMSAYEPRGGGIGVWNPVTQQFDYTDRVQFG